MCSNICFLKYTAKLHCPWNNAVLARIAKVTKHSVSFATGGLTISKNGCIIALHQLVDVVSSDFIVDLLLRRELVTDAIEAELAYAIVDHGVIVLEGRCTTWLKSAEDPDLGICGFRLHSFLQFLHFDDLVDEVYRYFLCPWRRYPQTMFSIRIRIDRSVGT